MNIVRVSGVYGTKTKMDFHGNAYYRTTIQSKRSDTKENNVDVIFADYLAKEMEGFDKILVTGQLVKMKSKTPGKGFDLFVKAKTVEPYYMDFDINEVVVDGVVSKEPSYKEKENGNCFSHFAIFNKKTRIECSTWNSVAILMEQVEKGDNIKVYGYVQSHEVKKGKNTVTNHEVAACEVALL